MKSADPVDGRVLEIVSAAAAAEPDQVTLRTVELVLKHDGDPQDLSVALIADEI
jgi:hypothetical protein